jgi:hypothetical protein
MRCYEPQGAKKERVTQEVKFAVATFLEDSESWNYIYCVNLYGIVRSDNCLREPDVIV